MNNLIKSTLLISGIVLAAPVVAADGAKIYTQSCASCHGAKGEGMPMMAPKLQGNAFLKSSDAAAITSLIKKGRMGADKKYKDIPTPMPPQAGLSGDQLKALTSYLKGTFAK